VARTRGALVSKIDPTTGESLLDTGVDARPFPMAVAAGSLWVRNEQGSSVSRIDETTGRLQATIPVDPFYGIDGVDSIAVTNGKIWISGLNLQEIDPATNRVARNLSISGRPLAAGDGTLWVIGIAGAISRIRVSP
jgi:DNA-binding beta-propeller fold protein YncE